MIRLILLLLTLVCAMPSTSASAPQHSSEQSLDANARISVRKERLYYARRKYYKRSYRRHMSSPIRIVGRSSSSTPEVAPKSVELLSQQDPVRWGDVDVSKLHKPMDTWLVFPPDPGKFKLPTDPPNIDSMLPRVYDEAPRTFYIFALALLAVLGTGMTAELNKARTCHKRDEDSLDIGRKRPVWMPLSVWWKRNALSKLT